MPALKDSRKLFEKGSINYLDDATYEGISIPWPKSRSNSRWMKRSVLRRAPLGALAAEMALTYAKDNEKTALFHLQGLTFYQVQDFMAVDETTKRNLETDPVALRTGEEGVSLLGFG